MIQVEGLCKSFGSQEVLRDVSFDIQPGEFTALIGLSGCGKSLLLKHLVGLLKPDRGRILILFPASTCGSRRSTVDAI